MGKTSVATPIEGSRSSIVSVLGTVTGFNEKRQHTVEARGGGGFLVRGTGYIAAPTVSVKTRTWRDVFYRCGDTEGLVTHRGHLPPLQEGHDIHALLIEHSNAAREIIALQNSSTGDATRYLGSAALLASVKNGWSLRNMLLAVICAGILIRAWAVLSDLPAQTFELPAHLAIRQFIGTGLVVVVFSIVGLLGCFKVFSGNMVKVRRIAHAIAAHNEQIPLRWAGISAPAGVLGPLLAAVLIGGFGLGALSSLMSALSRVHGHTNMVRGQSSLATSAVAAGAKLTPHGPVAIPFGPPEQLYAFDVSDTSHRKFFIAIQDRGQPFFGGQLLTPDGLNRGACRVTPVLAEGVPSDTRAYFVDLPGGFKDCWLYMPGNAKTPVISPLTDKLFEHIQHE